MAQDASEPTGLYEKTLSYARARLASTLGTILSIYACVECGRALPTMYGLISGGYGCDGCIPAILARLIINELDVRTGS